MKRTPPPPRPLHRAEDGGFYYTTAAGNCCYVVPGPPSPPPDPLHSEGPGPELTPGEQIFEQFLRDFEPQAFDYVFAEDGQLRQYWCPHCGDATIAHGWHCEHCRRWFNAKDIEDQTDKPPISIGHDVAESLARAFHEILYGADARDALKLKNGRGRRDYRKYFVMRDAAYYVAQKIARGISKTSASEDVAGRFHHFVDARTIARWYDEFYNRDNQPRARCPSLDVVTE